MDLVIEYVNVNDKKYKLQHPGNREVLKLRSRCTDPKSGAVNLEYMMDYCFEHVVIPDGHNFRPSLDNLHPKEFENWLELLPGFLRRGDVGRFRHIEQGVQGSKKAG